MIDTVVLQIVRSDFQILDHSSFQPPTTLLETDRSGHSKYVNNPTKDMKSSGSYYPRLTVIKRGTAITLRIECSLPKLLFGNNLDELEEKDFDKVIHTLKVRLVDMGVLVSTNVLLTAQVLAIHFGKNIPLNAGYTASYVIRELAKVDLTQRLDLTTTQFRNEGMSLQYYSASHSCVFYDKIADLNKAKARAIDKDQTGMQFSIFDQIAEKKQRTEVLRLEVRLSKRRKLKEVLKMKDPKICDLFKDEIAKQVVQKYWQGMVESGRLLLVAEDPFALLDSILLAYPDIKPKQAVYLVGLGLLAKEKGFRSIKQHLYGFGIKRTLQRIQKDFQQLQGLEGSDTAIGWLQQIEVCLNEFTAYKALPFTVKKRFTI
ncbi:hypothetical protein HOD24_01550 [Candidatus Peregrinibacteria bacterium]|jgi:hypothetical protein|nr:hypothetical protein [Candidatus Peregrinibacteria bacterium]